MNDTEQVDRPRFDQLRVALGGDFTGFHRQSEGILRVSSGVGETGEAIERFRFADAIGFGPGNDAGLNRELAGYAWVELLLVRRALQQVSYGLRRDRLG